MRRNPPRWRSRAEAIAPEAGEDVGIPLELVKEQGLAYLRNRQFAAAEAMYDLAIKVAPDDAVNYGMRGYVNMRALDYEAAGDDFRRLIELEPDDFDGHSALCWSYGELGQFASARRHCERALAQSDSATEYVIALENRCWLFVEMGDYEAAAEDCLNVLEALPACRHEVCALAHYNLGRILVTQGELQQALAQFNLATAIGTSYPDMYLEIASVYDTMGYRSAAALHLEKYRALAGGG